MSEENAAKLLRAFRMAVEAGQDGIADELGDLILDFMSYRTKPVMRGTFVDGDGEVVG